MTPSSPDPEAGPAGGGGRRAPATHRPEVGLFVGAHAAASHEQRRQAAGPAAAPAPQQQAAVRHGCRRNPHGPGALRRRGSAAADGERPVAPACGGPLGTERAQDSVAGPPRSGKPTLPTRASPDPGALTSAVRRALGPGRSGRSAASIKRSWRRGLRRRAWRARGGRWAERKGERRTESGGRGWRRGLGEEPGRRGAGPKGAWEGGP